MAHHEQASLPRVFDPLIAIVANKEVGSVRVCVVGVHEFKTDSDTDTWKKPKQEVWVEEHFGLLLEKLSIVPDSVDVRLGHIFEVYEVVFWVHRQIEDLCRQNEGSKPAEGEGIKSFFAVTDKENGEKQHKCENMEENPWETIALICTVFFSVICTGRAPVRHDTEGEEVAVRAQK